jgi:hypothetical protein
MSGGIGLSAANADTATTTAARARAPFRRTPFDKANPGSRTLNSLALKRSNMADPTPDLYSFRRDDSRRLGYPKLSLELPS